MIVDRLMILVLLFGLSLSFGLCESALANDVVLVVQVDGARKLVNSKRDEQLFRDLYKEYLPEHKLVVVKKPKRKPLPRKAYKEVNPTDQVTHIVIQAKGSTQADSDGHFVTKLESIGEIHEDQVSESLGSVFDEIKDRVSPDVTVSMQACESFCGTKLSVLRRGRALLEYFSAPHGQIYGATSVEYPEAVGFEGYSGGPLGQVFHSLAWAQVFGVLGTVFVVGGVDYASPLYGELMYNNPLAVATAVELTYLMSSIGLKKLDSYKPRSGWILKQEGNVLQMGKIERSRANRDQVFIGSDLNGCHKILSVNSDHI